MQNPDGAKVRYSVDGSYYDIPTEKVEDFEKSMPQARQVYRVGDETFAIPLDKREGFAAQYPDAELWNGGYANPDYKPQQAQTEEVQPAEKPNFWARLAKNLSGAESSPQGMPAPQPQPQPQQPEPVAAEEPNEDDANFDATYDAYTHVINSRLAAKSQALAERSQEREGRMGRWLSSIYNAGQAEGGAVVPQAREEIAQGGDPEADQLRAASQLFDGAKKLKDAATQKKGLLSGLADSFSVDTWDFGVTDMKTAQQVYSLAQKLEAGEELSENDNLLLEAMVQNAYANETYGSQLKRGYKAGQVTGESLPFMLEFLLNPLAGGSEAASGGAVKVLERRLAKEIAKRGARGAEKTLLEKGGELAMKGVARAADDLVSAAGMAATTGSVRTLGDAYSRKTGYVQYNEDEDGNLAFGGFTGAEKEWWRAAAKAYGATTIEDFSEMFGNYFRPIGQAAGKVAGRVATSNLGKKLGLGKVKNFIDNVGTAEWVKALDDFTERTDWNGVLGEFGEEIVGGVMNALTVGDQTLDPSDPNGVFNPENLIDTFLGVAVFGGFVSSLKTAGYRPASQRNETMRERTAEQGASVLGDKWEGIQKQIDESGEDGIGEMLVQVSMPDSGYTKEEKEAIMDYARVRLERLGMEKGQQKKEEYIEEGVEEGRNATSPEDINRLEMDAEYAREKAERESERGVEPSGEAEIGVEHANAVMRGRKDAMRDGITRQIGQEFWTRGMVDDQETDMVHSLTYPDGREVFFISDDGGMFATIDSNGEKGFMNAEQIAEATERDGALDASMTLDQYLDRRIGAQNSQAEQTRMAQDAANNLAAVQQRTQEEGRVNIGTPESELWAPVVEMTQAGVAVQVEGEELPRVLPWSDVAKSFRMPLEPKTNQDIVSARLSAEDEVNRYNKTIAPGARLDVPLVGLEEGETASYQFVRAENVDGDVIIKAYDPDLEQEIDLVPSMISNMDAALGNVAASTVDVQGNPVPEAAAESTPVQIFDDPAANELGISEDYAYTTKKGQTVVDGSKLWAENPTLWAEWNDRNPNRVISTKDYLSGKLADIEKDVNNARKALEDEVKGSQNPDRIEELQESLSNKINRQQEVQSLLSKYDAAEQAAVEAAQQQAEEAAPVEEMPAQPQQEPLAEMVSPDVANAPASAEAAVEDAQKTLEELNRQMAVAESQEERDQIMEAKAVVLQQMFDALGAKNTVVSTMATLFDDMQRLGASQRELQEVQDELAYCRAKRFTMEGFYCWGADTIFMVADGLPTAEFANRINIHEAKHRENRFDGANMVALTTGVTRGEMVSVMRQYKQTDFYDKKPSDYLADEVLAVGAEIAEDEGVDAIPERLRELGVTNEDFINFVQNNIKDGRQRDGQRQHYAARNALQHENPQDGGGYDAGSGRGQSGDLGGSGIRSSQTGDGSRGEAGSGEPAAEPAPAGESGAVEEPAAETPAEEEITREITANIGGSMEGKDGNVPVNFSISAGAEGVGLTANESDEAGNVTFVMRDGRVFDGHHLLTAEDVKNEPNTVMGYMMADALKYGTITPEQADIIWQKYTDTLNRMLEKGLAENGGFDNLSSQWQWVGETVFKTVSTNSDDQYKFSLDITRVCKKNEAVINAISAVQRRLGYGITPGQVMDIYMSGIEEGYQVPCPVCYVFSRYISNGIYATIAINGQKKYGKKLVDPSTLTEKQREAKVKMWQKELEKLEERDKKYQKQISSAKDEVGRIFARIDEIGRKLPGMSAKEKAEAQKEIKALDKRYKAALNLISQSSLSQWIKNFAIHEVNGETVLYEDSFQGFPPEYALDLRLTADTIRKYPAIQRLRKSGGSAAGKEIHFAANNDMGDVLMMLGASNLKKAPNYYQEAVKEEDPTAQKALLKKASEQFRRAMVYAQQQSLRGGQRMWSWSDNIERLAPDVFFNLMQLQMLGGALQSYSKQLEGANLVANMGGYVNGSLMGHGKGYQEVSDADIEEVDGEMVLKADITDTVTEKTPEGDVQRTRVLAEAGSPIYEQGGKRYVLLFDDVVGIDAHGREENGKRMKGLFWLNKTLDKAGNILVGMNDIHVRAAMADKRVFFIIPWHASGLAGHLLRQMMGYLGVNTARFKAQDYTDVQEEKVVGKEGKPITPELHDFWEAHKNETDFACGIDGGIPSGEGENLSEQQIRYKSLRDAIFTGVKVDGKTVPVGEIPEMMAAINADAFLSQVYRKVQERVVDGDMTSGDTKYIYPYEYWDEGSTYDTADINGARYLEYCRRLGVKPKFVGKLGYKTGEDFGNFADDKGYWKLLIDRRMYDTKGNFQDLTPVTTDNYNPDMVDPEKTGEEFHVTRVADEEGVERMADRMLATEKARTGSLATVDYGMTLEQAAEKYEEAGLTKTQKKALAFVNGTQVEDEEEEEPSIRPSVSGEQDEETQRLFDAAKERFGVTKDIREAGYVLPDGAMLDFSGRHWLAPGSDSSYLAGDRQVDHRDIADLEYERDGNTPTGIKTSMSDFIRRGAIRIHDGSGASINLSVKPTPEQNSVLERLIDHNNGDVYLDLGDGEHTDASTFYDGAKARRILNDIKRYFDEGVKPDGGIRFSLRGIIGAEDDTEAMKNLSVAEEMEKAGKDARTIWQATGWERGKDGKWRNEIHDGEPKEIPDNKRIVRVKDVIDAPELFASYPQIAEYPVKIKKLPGNLVGTFRPREKDILVDSDYAFGPASDGMKQLNESGRSTMAHELQHAIQDIEGFARGGSPSGRAQSFLDEQYAQNPAMVSLARLYAPVKKNSPSLMIRVGKDRIATALENSKGNFPDGEAQRRVQELIDYLRGISDTDYTRFVKDAWKLWKESQNRGLTDYGKLAGEVEARNVQRRMQMMLQGRAAIEPSFTEDVAREEQLVRFSVREGEPPKKTGIGYKVFYQKDGKLYPPMVANAGGVDTPVGVWLDAEAAPIVGESKTGRPKVKQGGKGTQGGSGTLAYRPGWHLGEIPYALQFNRVNPETGKKELFPKDFVWAEVEYAMDNDYQQEAEAEGMTDGGKFRHSYAGLKRVPENGYYRYRTNPNPETDPWIITGAMKVNRILTNDEVDNLVRQAGREPQQRENDILFSIAYHGSKADFTEFEEGHYREGTGSFHRPGFYFASDENSVRVYAYDRGNGAFIYEVELPDDNGTNYLDVFKSIPKSERRVLAEKISKTFPEKQIDVEKKIVNKQIAGEDLMGMFTNEELEKLGYVGIVGPMHIATMPQKQYIMFNPKDIKIKTKTNVSTGESVRFSVANANQEVFVSNAQRAVENIRQEKATPEQWLKMVEKNGGLKAGEDKWLGLSDWLKDSDKKTLTKQEVLDFIEENKIKIEETRYGGSLRDEIQEIIGRGRSLDSLQNEIDEIRESEEYKGLAGDNIDADLLTDVMVDRYGDDFEMGYVIDEEGVIDYDIDAYADREYSENRHGKTKPIHFVRRGYTTDGLENNREIALTIPSIDSWNQQDEIHFGDAGEGRAVAWIRFGDAAKDGQRVLFIDEIQSKRHQEGREKGYKTGQEMQKAQELTERYWEIDGEYNRLKTEEAQILRQVSESEEGKSLYGDDGLILPGKIEEYNKLLENNERYAEIRKRAKELARERENVMLQVQQNAKSASEAIPAAPFEKNWQELAMKRMLRLAAEEGYDYVAWTKGEQQADRYNLSRLIDEVEVKEVESGDATREVKLYNDGIANFDFGIDNDGNIVTGTHKGETLAGFVGKEMAAQIMDMKDGERKSTDQFKIGGEGMKGFYDEMLPRFMNKYGKQWGVKVEDITLPGLENGSLSAHAVPVTQEMKDSVMEGQLMFSVREEQDQPEQSPVGYGQSIDSRKAAATDVAEKCGVQVEFKPSSEMQLNGKPLAGRWENGRISICPEHCRDTEEVIRTVLHEGVGHNGLRRLVGDRNMSDFCLDIFRALPDEERATVADSAVNEHGGNVAEAVEEYLARKAETMDFDNEEYEHTIWDRVRGALRSLLTKAGINVPLSENDVRWLLWQSYNANRQDDAFNEAKRQTVARELGFTLHQQAEETDALQSARNRFADEDLAPAARLYNRDVMNWMNRLHETWVDKDDSVIRLVEALEKATGKKAAAFEDVRLALNQQSSKGLAAIEKFEREHYNPMMRAIKDLMKSKGCDLHAVERYVMIKHGLERNEVFARRDAREYYRDVRDKAVEDIKANDQLSMTDKEALVAKEEAKYQRRLQNIEAGTDVKYRELRNQDYGGLTAMYSEFDPIEPFQEGVESEEEYNARVLQARHPKFTTVDEDGNEQVDMAATEAAARQEVEDFENGFEDDIKELWWCINGATKATLKHQYDSNMISRAQYNEVKDMFQYYVPLRGFADKTAEDMYDYYRSDQHNTFTPPLQKAKGRKTESESPFGYIGAMASSAIAADMKNETKLALYYFVSNRAANDLVTVSEVWYEKTGEDAQGKSIFEPVYPPFTEGLNSEEAKKSYEDWEKAMQEKAKSGVAFKGTKKLDLKNSVIHIDDRQKASHVIKFKVGGRDMMMFINGNPRAAQAINNELNVEMSADYQKVFGKVLRWFSGINTSYNPEFWLSNAQRDILFALMGVNVKENAEYNKAFRKTFASIIRKTLTPGAKGGAYSLKRKFDEGELGDEKLDRYYEEFVDNGGVTGYTVLKNNEEWEAELRKYTGPERTVLKGIKTVFEKVQNFGEAIEQMSRFAAYATSRDMGKDIKDAVNDAKELTVNFNRKGSGKAISFEEAEKLRTKDGKKLNLAQKAFVVGASWIPVYGRRFIMFFNAAVQGLNAMYKLVKKDPGRLATWTAGYFALGVVQALIHAMLDDDDDYLDIPDYERRNNLLIGGDGYYFKWALPQESRIFYAVGDMAVNHLLGREPHRSMLNEVALALADVAPLNPAGGISALAPSAVTPFVEVALNRDFKGAKIYNDLKYLSDEERERTPSYQKAYPGTGKVYVGFSQFANWLSGGDYADAGWFNVNPAAVEHILQGATGGAGTTLGKLYRGTIGQALGEEFMVRNTPFLGRLLTVTDERYRNAHTTDLFDYYKAEAEHTKKRMKAYRKAGDDKRLNRLLESDDYQVMNIYESYKERLKWFNDELKATTDQKERRELMKEQDAVRKDMIMEISNIGNND